jgi:hypothetical protein
MKKGLVFFSTFSPTSLSAHLIEVCSRPFISSLSSAKQQPLEAQLDPILLN